MSYWGCSVLCVQYPQSADEGTPWFFLVRPESRWIFPSPVWSQSSPTVGYYDTMVGEDDTECEVQWFSVVPKEIRVG